LDKDLLVEWKVEEARGEEKFVSGRREEEVEQLMIGREEEEEANPDDGTAVFTVRAVLGHLVITVWQLTLVFKNSILNNIQYLSFKKGTGLFHQCKNTVCFLLFTFIKYSKIIFCSLCGSITYCIF
jgi:hypothetical protein